MSDPAGSDVGVEQPGTGLTGASANGWPGSRKGGVRVKIGWKITTLVVLVLTALAVVNIIFTRDRFRETMNREFESKALAIALSIAGTSEDKLLAGNTDVLQTMVDNFREVHGIRYVYIQDSGGEVVAHTFDRNFPERILGLNPVTGQEKHRILRFQSEGVGDILEVAVPILFGVAGTAHVGMDESLITAELDGITRGLIVQFAVAQLVGIILLHLMVIFLLRHMRTVLSTLRRVGDGDLTARVRIPTRDEFLDLAQSLNGTLSRLEGMIGNVGHSYEGISRANIRIAQVYNEVLEGTEQQAGLASESMDSVVSNKKMIDEVTEGIRVLENSSHDSFSSVIEMGASIEEVSSMADDLFRSVNESNRAIEELSRSVDEINRNLLTFSQTADETSSAMNEMSASILQVRGNAESTSQDAVKMTKVAEEGATLSRNAMEGMEAIKVSSGQVTAMISLVSDRIEEIDEILKFITDITGKTNLLALNAAIIAAQAGAQGKGFGVVADEINELAQNTKAQTNRIAHVIQGLREEVSRTSEAVTNSSRKVEEGVVLSGKVTTALEGIMDNTMLVSHRVEEIAQTTSEQASTSNRVLEASQHLTDSVSNIKGVSEQQKQAADKLLQMSRLIQQAAQKVKSSTEEQTITSQQINKDLTRISDTVRTISESTGIQVVNGDKVLRLTGDLGGVIEKNKASVLGLKGIIDDLNKRMGSLHQELENFVTGQEDQR